MKNKREIRVFTHQSGLRCIRFSHNGKQHYVYAKTTRECRKKYGELASQLEKRETKSTGYTFVEWYEKWIQLYKSHLKENSLRLLKGVFNKHILPKLKKKVMRRITSQDIQPIFNKMTKETPRQATIAYIQLKACFEQAYKLGYITRNPCLAVVIKKNKGENGKGLTKQQQKQLVEYMDKHENKFNNLVLLYLNTGMRRGELLSVEQEDVNRETNEIHIRGKKTATSDRILQTSKQVIDLIPTKIHPFIEWTPDHVDREFNKIVKALKFEKITLHSLRHTFATNCVESGVDMTVLQKWLGHKSITMTIDRYTHISEDYKKQEQAKVKTILLH